jgi:6-phosphogluconolactonase (cycloisomerase 2 family)
VEQKAKVDVGIYAHQVVVAPSNRIVIFPARGNDASDGKPEDPGAIKVFSFDNGQLANAQNIVGGRNGFDYRPRHVDFHPTKPWMYANIESQNELHMHRLNAAGDQVEAIPAFTSTTLAIIRDPKLRQTTSAIHVHPSGRFVYSGNRADSTGELNGKRVFAGGENSIAVFAIDQTTGEPTLIQHADTRGFNPRTFAIDAGGRVLVVGNQLSVPVRDGERVKPVPASLTIFRIRDNGTLEFSQTYPMEVAPSRSLFWMGMASLR